MLLRRAGFRFTVSAPDVDEQPEAGEVPVELVERLAAEKARSAASAGPAGVVALGADTAVVLEGRPLGKPADADDAVRMLLSLSGRVHEVVTGYALYAGPGERLELASVSTRVDFAAIGPSDAEEYVATGEPMDKAGAYAIQGIGWRFVRSLDGSFTNVMGLPMEEVAPALMRHGVHPDATS